MEIFMRSREVQGFLASITGRSLGEIDQRTRLARKAFEIPSGPRGRNAPHMNIAEGLVHLLTLPSRRVSDSWDVAMKLLNASLVPHPSHPGLSSAFLGEARSLMFWLMSANTKDLDDIGFQINSFELFDTGQYAVMNFHRRSLRNLRFVFSDNPQHSDADQGQSEDIYSRIDEQAAGNRFVIGAAHLKTLGDLIRADRPDNEGVSGVDAAREPLIVATGGDDG